MKTAEFGFVYQSFYTCKCPLCERLYPKRMEWSGNGMPRKYCKPCREILRNMDNEPEGYVRYNKLDDGPFWLRQTMQERMVS